MITKIAVEVIRLKDICLRDSNSSRMCDAVRIITHVVPA